MYDVDIDGSTNLIFVLSKNLIFVGRKEIEGIVVQVN